MQAQPHPAPDLAHARAALQAAGLKQTHQRALILAALRQSVAHLSAEALHAQLAPAHPGLSLATVYRTTEALAAAGLLRRVPTADGVLRFDGKTEGHHHLCCEATGQIHDYDDPELTALLERYFAQRRIEGFTVQSVQLQILGRFTGPEPGTALPPESAAAAPDLP